MNMRSSFNLKSKDNKLKLSHSGLKKVSTISNSGFFKTKKIEKDYSFKIKESSTFNRPNKEKNPFDYLNGEDDEEENEKKDNNDENPFDYLNGEKKMNNIKVYKDEEEKNKFDDFYHKKKHYLEIINEDDPLYMPTEESDSEKTNSNNNKNNNNNNPPQLKKTVTLSTMKLKNFELKLIDFGCAKIFSKYKTNFGEIIGTLIYCSPEVLKNNYNKECDIWSCGVIMYALLSGHFPFYSKNEEEIKRKILSGKFEFNPKYFNNVSDKAKDLIKKCLIYDKYKRISAEDALKHEFFMDDINPNNIFEDEIDTKNILLSLKNFSYHSKIYQTVLTYLSHNFTDKEELNKLKKIFYKIDLNLDGKLSKSEFEQAFKEAGIDINKEQIETMMKSIDFDGNGFIEYEEFIRVALPKEKLFTEKNLKIAFDMLDLDKNGKISLDEFKTILGIKKINDKKVNEELLNEIPIKENEEMTFEQFKLLFLKDNQVISKS
jgi:calcium-dependent protein kinase